MTDVHWVKRQTRDYLLGKPGVVACGVGFKEIGGVSTDEQCVVVSVERKIPAAELAASDLIPRALGLVRTDVREVGVIRALPGLIANVKGPADRYRPAPGGVSIGHIEVTAGTLGCLVRRGGDLFILSNNHVLANSNVADIGDPIIQPGRYDGGSLNDQIATLEEFVRLDFGDEEADCPVVEGLTRFVNWISRLLGRQHRMAAYRLTDGVNRMDAAIARPLSDDLVDGRILGLGMPKGAGEATLGMAVQKSGRTTGLTTGKITQIDITARVSYGNGRMATFEDQLMAGAMSAGGDSGSVVLDEGGLVVGLLFAGSDAITLMNPIGLVLDALDVEIVV